MSNEKRSKLGVRDKLEARIAMLIRERIAILLSVKTASMCCEKMILVCIAGGKADPSTIFEFKARISAFKAQLDVVNLVFMALSCGTVEQASGVQLQTTMVYAARRLEAFQREFSEYIEQTTQHFRPLL
jgi:hypothetical protein